MDKNSIDENKAIQDGLEKFLDQEINGYDLPPGSKPGAAEKTLKTEFAKDAMSAQGVREGLELVHGQEEKELARQAEIRRMREERQLQAERARQAEKRRAEEKRSQMELERQRLEEDEEEDEDWDLRRDRRRNRTKEPDRHTRRKAAPGKAKQNKSRKNKPSGKRGKAGKKKPSKAKKVCMILLLVALALLLWWFIMVGNIYKKMNYEKAEESVTGSMKEDGVINVLLIGNDSRENGEDGRSDAMILVSISSKTKTIHMTSLLRDMYVEIPGHDGNRLNAAYAYGGASLLCETIEQNFGIEVNRYALVNFQAFANLVDAVGGVNLEVTSEEVKWINAYLNEYNLLEGKDITTDYLDESLSGEIHLNGPQALAYSRNRYIGTDFGRTERQRKVLSAVMKKLPLALATNSSELIDGLFPNLTTNLKQTEVYALSLDASKLLTYDVVQMAIPAEGTYTNATIREMAVLQVDFEANKALLQKEIYGKE